MVWLADYLKSTLANLEGSQIPSKSIHCFDYNCNTRERERNREDAKAFPRKCMPINRKGNF